MGAGVAVEPGVESDQDRARTVRGLGRRNALSLAHHRNQHADRDLQLVIEHLDEFDGIGRRGRSEEHTSELQSLMRISYAVFCLKKKNTTQKMQSTNGL